MADAVLRPQSKDPRPGVPGEAQNARCQPDGPDARAAGSEPVKGVRPAGGRLDPGSRSLAMRHGTSDPNKARRRRKRGS